MIILKMALSFFIVFSLQFVGGNGLLLGTPAVTVSPTSPIAAELQQILTIFHNETTKLQQYVAVLERKMIDGETTLQQKLNKSEEQVYKLSTELQAEKTKRMQLQRDTDDLVLKFYNLSLSYNSIASKTHLLQNENTVMKNDIRNLTGVLSGVNFSSILLNPSHLQQKQGMCHYNILATVCFGLRPRLTYISKT